MFSQSSIDQMSIEELVQLIKTMANEVEGRIDYNPEDAIDYCNAVCNLANSLRERIEKYTEDVA